MPVLAAEAASNTGWVIGYAVGIAVVLVVVALVVPILVLARKIGNEAKAIDDGLVRAADNTAALAELNTTIAYAVNVIEGLGRGRKRLGG